MTEETITKKDIENLFLRIELLEARLQNKDSEISDKEREILRLKEKLDEPAPLLNRSIPTPTKQNARLKETLSSLSPAELIVLARKNGIKIEEIFPL